MTLEELKALAAEYLLTKDDTHNDEWWDTDRGIYSHGVDNFIDWLEHRHENP